MTFKTDDLKTKEYSQKGVKVRKEIQEDRFKWIVGRGFEKATDVINDMLDGVPVTKEQQEAVRLLEKFVGYEKGKMSSSEVILDARVELTMAQGKKDEIQKALDNM